METQLCLETIFFLYKSNLLNLELWGKSVQGFLSYEWYQNKQTDKQRLLLYIILVKKINWGFIRNPWIFEILHELVLPPHQLHHQCDHEGVHHEPEVPQGRHEELSIFGPGEDQIFLNLINVILYYQTNSFSDSLKINLLERICVFCTFAVLMLFELLIIITVGLPLSFNIRIYISVWLPWTVWPCITITITNLYVSPFPENTEHCMYLPTRRIINIVCISLPREP